MGKIIFLEGMIRNSFCYYILGIGFSDFYCVRIKCNSLERAYMCHLISICLFPILMNANASRDGIFQFGMDILTECNVDTKTKNSEPSLLIIERTIFSSFFSIPLYIVGVQLLFRLSFYIGLYCVRKTSYFPSNQCN